MASEGSVLTVPAPLRTFFSYFPLHTYPAIRPPFRAESAYRTPTLWVLPPNPSEADLLSADVECLKWQAYLALRGLTKINLRWDVAPDGGIDGRLPCLHVPAEDFKDESGEGELLAAHMIPGWMDGKVGEVDELEGYKDAGSKDESRAWVGLLEGNVHAALLLAQPSPSVLSIIKGSAPARPIENVLSTPAASLSGLAALFPPFGTRISHQAVQERYVEAIESLSERLSTDKWLLGSENPTALDALLFAYLHCILHSKDTVRREVTRCVNLVAWERRVASAVRAAFHKA